MGGPVRSMRQNPGQMLGMCSLAFIALPASLAIVALPTTLAFAARSQGLPQGAKLPNLQARLPFIQASYLDLATAPGRRLYRFDSAIYNAGPGAFEIFYDHPAGRVWQILYGRSGVSSQPLCPKPPAKQRARCVRANRRPSDPNIVGRISMSAKGARMKWAGDNHQHWHVQGVARYTLTSTAGTVLNINKTGFCMYDLLGKGKGFYTGFNWAGNDWCQHRKGTSAVVVRMGISPGHADHYANSIAGQFVDVTGQPPGVYKLKATIDPKNIVAETNERDQSITQLRTIPGVIAANLGPVAVPANGAAALTVPDAQLVAPLTPVKTSAGAPPRSWTRAEVTAGLVYSVLTPPAHGVMGAFAGPKASYQATAGYVGPDSFTYIATDPRGLASAPATVTMKVG